MTLEKSTHFVFFVFFAVHDLSFYALFLSALFFMVLELHNRQRQTIITERITEAPAAIQYSEQKVLPNLTQGQKHICTHKLGK